MPQPWYRQFWPWFLICLPMLAVIMGVSMLIVAINTPVNLISEDYYREGQEINQDLAQLQQAKDLNITAILTEQPPSQLIFDINVSFFHVCVDMFAAHLLQNTCSLSKWPPFTEQSHKVLHSFKNIKSNISSNNNM